MLRFIEQGLQDTVDWYRTNTRWWQRVQDGAYRKSSEMISSWNPAAALQFHWVEMERVVRVEGLVQKASDAESDDYYQSRPLAQRLRPVNRLRAAPMAKWAALLMASVRGVLAGYPLVDFEVELYDGSYHSVDSNEMSFKMAGILAFKTVAQKCRPVLLEPLDEVEITAPADFLGDVMGDLAARRGQILGTGAEPLRRLGVTVQPEQAAVAEDTGVDRLIRRFAGARGTLSGAGAQPGSTGIGDAEARRGSGRPQRKNAERQLKRPEQGADRSGDNDCAKHQQHFAPCCAEKPVE